MGLQLPKFNMPKLPSLPGIPQLVKPKLDPGLSEPAPSHKPKLLIVKILMILVPVGAVVFAGVMVTSLGQQVEKLKREIVSHQLKVEGLSVVNQELTTQLSALSKERTDADRLMSSLQEQLAAATDELEDAKTELGTLQWRFERVSETRLNLETQLAGLTKKNKQRQLRLERLSSERQELEDASMRLRERLNFIDRDYQLLTQKVKDLELEKTKQRYNVGERSVDKRTTGSYAGSRVSSTGYGAGYGAAPGPTLELPPIIVRRDGAGISGPVRGRLVEVNQPHQFIVVDKGAVDGVRVGMTFDVLRGSGGETVAQATVVRVRPQLAACDFVGATGGAPQVGDVAVQRNR